MSDHEQDEDSQLEQQEEDEQEQLDADNAEDEEQHDDAEEEHDGEEDGEEETSANGADAAENPDEEPEEAEAQPADDGEEDGAGDNAEDAEDHGDDSQLADEHGSDSGELVDDPEAALREIEEARAFALQAQEEDAQDAAEEEAREHELEHKHDDHESTADAADASRPSSSHSQMESSRVPSKPNLRLDPPQPEGPDLQAHAVRGTAAMAAAIAAVAASAIAPSPVAAAEPEPESEPESEAEEDDGAEATVAAVAVPSSPPRPDTPPPRPATPLDLTSGPAGDVIAGPQRQELSTHDEREIKQVKYAAGMAEQWVRMLQQKQEATQGGKIDQQQTIYLMEHLVPILVEALSELLRVCEGEARAAYVHAKQLRKNPSLKPRQPVRPLEWLASYLVRHNPKHVPNDNPLTLIYQKSIKEIVQKMQQTSEE